MTEDSVYATISGSIFQGCVGIGTPLLPSNINTDLHIRENNNDIKPALAIEQLGSGDAGLQFSMIDCSYNIGIDNSDSNKLKISYSGSCGDAVLGNNDFFVVDNNGKIGIGTSSPLCNLHISSSNGLPAVLKTDGNVLLDTIRPQLTLKGTRADLGSGACDMYFWAPNSPGASNCKIFQFGNINATSIGGSNFLTIKTLDDTFHTKADTAFSVKHQGSSNADIGMGVFDPSTNLHISENNNSLKPALEIEQKSSGDAALQFSIANGAFAIGIDNSDSDKLKISHSLISGSARLGTNDRVVVDNIGQVGIGISSPDSQLHIHKASAGNVDARLNTVLTIENNNNCYINLLTPDSNESGILFGKPSGNNHGGILYNAGSAVDGFEIKVSGSNTVGSWISHNSKGILHLGPSSSATAPGRGYLRGVAGSGIDRYGAPIVIEGGQSTGNANGGAIEFNTSPAGISGNSPNLFQERMRIESNGRVQIIEDLYVAKNLDISGTLTAGNINVYSDNSSLTASISTTSVSFINVLDLTTNIPTTGNYIIFFSTSCNAGLSAAAFLRLYDKTDEEFLELNSTSELDGTSLSGFKIRNLTSGTRQFKLQLRSSSSGATATIISGSLYIKQV